jgi:hypothetical protein
MTESNTAPTHEPGKDLAANGNAAGKNERYQPVKQHLYSDLKGEAVILNMENGKYYGLNGVGVSIWKALSDAASVTEIESAILAEYEVDAETCRAEVQAFVSQMLDEKLIEKIDA